LLELESAAFGYGDGFVVQGVTFRLDAGDFVLLTGPNGSGKTTLIRGVLGLIRQTGGILRRRVPPRRLGYVPQEATIHSDAPATAFDVVRLGVSGGWGTGRSKAMAALRTVGMETMADVRYGRLSGGQKRRVLLAKAMACDPLLLVLDEPTANVDRGTEDRIERLLYRLTAESGVGVLAASHSNNWAASARRVSIGGGGAE
jgi:ABC-type Mn2+/Zn2+ transport system ATPase subunit